MENAGRSRSAAAYSCIMADAQENLTDGELQSEIELVGDLVVAATSSEGPLPQEEIDRLLGVKAAEESAAAAHEAAQEAAHEAAQQAAQEAGAGEETGSGQEIEPSREQAPETD